MSSPIIFYDIPSQIPGNAWSPNTYKTRYCLNYKGIPYTTVWIEYPDIEALCKKIGAAPTALKADGSPLYTLPVIYDPNTSTAVADSILIAEYLDATYPGTPLLIPAGTHALQHAFIAAHRDTVDALWQFALPATNPKLNPRSEEYFRRTREIRFGGRVLEDVVPKGEDRVKQWKEFEDGYGKIDAWLQRGKGPFLMGDTVSFGDFVVAGYILWSKKIWGVESLEWEDIKSWHEGRWDALVKLFEKYETVV